MAEPKEEPRKRRLTDEEIVFPEKAIKLIDGRSYTLRPWGARGGRLVLQRLDELAQKVGGEFNARAMLARAWEECLELLCLSIGGDVTPESIEQPAEDGGWHFEDVLRATDAMIEVCILRADGSGALPLVIDLVKRMNEILVTTLGPKLVRPRSSDSSEADTSTGTSGNGSGSSKRPEGEEVPNSPTS